MKKTTVISLGRIALAKHGTAKRIQELHFYRSSQQKDIRELTNENVEKNVTHFLNKYKRELLILRYCKGCPLELLIKLFTCVTPTERARVYSVFQKKLAAQGQLGHLKIKRLLLFLHVCGVFFK